jgi:hypothetical protein
VRVPVLPVRRVPVSGVGEEEVGEMLTAHVWTDSAAFVVGRGPSLTGFDFSRLAGLRWIGVNSLYLKNPAIAYSQDFRFLEFAMQRPDYWAADTFRLYHCLNEKDHPAIDARVSKLCSHPHRGNKWAESLDDHLPIGPSSAHSAVNLAAVLGANPIYLLGMDCRASEPMPETVPLEIRTARVRSGEVRRHFDDAEFVTPPEWSTGWNMYRDWIAAWEGFVAPAATAHGVTVINLINPEFPSALRCFETWPIEEVLH